MIFIGALSFDVNARQLYGDPDDERRSMRLLERVEDFGLGKYVSETRS